MEAAADYSFEHPVEKMKKFVLLLAAKSRQLIGKSVLLCRLPDDVAKSSPESSVQINRILREYPSAEGVGLTIVNIDSLGNVILEDSVRQQRMLVRWDSLLLSMYSKQE